MAGGHRCASPVRGQSDDADCPAGWRTGGMSDNSLEELGRGGCRQRAEPIRDPPRTVIPQAGHPMHRGAECGSAVLPRCLVRGSKQRKLLRRVVWRNCSDSALRCREDFRSAIGFPITTNAVTVIRLVTLASLAWHVSTPQAKQLARAARGMLHAILAVLAYAMLSLLWAPDVTEVSARSSPSGLRWPRGWSSTRASVSQQGSCSTQGQWLLVNRQRAG